MATIGGEVEGLRLYRSRAQNLPLQTLLCDFGVWYSVSRLDGLDGSGAVDGFLRPGNIGQAVQR